MNSDSKVHRTTFHLRALFAADLGNLFVQKTGPLEFALPGPNTPVVRIRPLAPDEYDAPEQQQVGIAACAVQATWHPGRRTSHGLEAIASGQIPTGVSIEQGKLWLDLLDGSGKPRKGVHVPFHALPPGLASFFDDVLRTSVSWATLTVKTLRWRLALMTGHIALPRQISYPEWSLDGEHWHILPVKLNVLISVSDMVVPTRQELQEISTHLAENRQEPIAHELYREALHQVSHKNQRAALIMAVAALEIGVKKYIADLVPDAHWLVENAPAPPIVTILEDYLPQLTARLTLVGKVKPPPEPVLAACRKAITARNSAVHSSDVSLQAESLREWLSSIEDVLWLLDYYSGNAWALEQLRPQTLSALGEVNESRTPGNGV